MSYVAPVTAVLIMRWTASAATSAGPTTRPMGSVARSSIAPLVEIVAEERSRQRRVDEAGCDQVDPDRREVEGEAGRERGHRRGDRRDDRGAGTDPPAAGAADEQQRAAGSHPAGDVAGDREREQHVLAERSARFFGVHFERGLVARAAARDQHVVDRCWQLLEESLQRSRIAGVEGGGALGAELEPSLLQALAVARREDDLGALGPGASGGLQTDPGAPADHDDGLPEQSWLARDRVSGGHGPMIRTRRRRRTRSTRAARSCSRSHWRSSGD